MSGTCSKCGKSTGSDWIKIHTGCVDFAARRKAATNDDEEVVPQGAIQTNIGGVDVNLLGKSHLEAIFRNLSRLAFYDGYKTTPSALFIRLDAKGTLMEVRALDCGLWREAIPADPEESDDEDTPAGFQYDVGVVSFGGDARRAEEYLKSSRQQWRLYSGQVRSKPLRVEDFTSWESAKVGLTRWFESMFEEGFLYIQRTKASDYKSSVESALMVSNEIISKKRKELDSMVVPTFSLKKPCPARE